MGDNNFIKWWSDPQPLEDEFLWFPLLVDQFGGDLEAAEAAWALGARPTGYPQGAP